MTSERALDRTPSKHPTTTFAGGALKENNSNSRTPTLQTPTLAAGSSNFPRTIIITPADKRKARFPTPYEKDVGLCDLSVPGRSLFTATAASQDEVERFEAQLQDEAVPFDEARKEAAYFSDKVPFDGLEDDIPPARRTRNQPTSAMKTSNTSTVPTTAGRRDQFGVRLGRPEAEQPPVASRLPTSHHPLLAINTSTNNPKQPALITPLAGVCAQSPSPSLLSMESLTKNCVTIRCYDHDALASHFDGNGISYHRLGIQID